MIDTHSHIYLEQFDTDRDEVIARAREVGIKKIILPNIDSESISAMLKTESDYPDLCHALIGLHPTSVKGNYRDELSVMEKKLGERKFIGIGEIGMDLYWDKTFLKEQKEVLAIQLKWASEKEIPVVIHTRDAFEEIFTVFEKHYDTRLRGVFHSFSGSLEDAKKILSMPNFYLGINGVVTYKKSHLPELLLQIGYDRLVLETDAPYLPPVPYRGKRNEPAYIISTKSKLAETFNVTTSIIEQTTSNNATKLFKIQHR
jgi:TatD DNase family protein